MRTAPIILDLADRMLEDIRERRLSVGDAYFTAADAARKLRTSTTNANRALQLLERRRVLTRSQRKGSIIAAPVSGGAERSIRRVNLVVAENYLKQEGLLAGGVVVGLQGALPGADLQFRFIPESEDLESVERILQEAHRSGEPEGFVLTRAPHAVQKAIIGSGMPSVILGTPFPMQRTAVSIDRDHQEVGRQLLDCLLKQGARRILLLLRPLVMMGDNLLMEAVQSLSSKAGLDSSMLIVRCLPPDREVVCETVLQILRSSEAPTGLLCRSEPLAAAAAAALDQLTPAQRRKWSRGIAVDIQTPSNEGYRWPSTHISLTPEEIGRKLGELLRIQAEGQMPNPAQYVLPVTLEPPTEA